MRVCMVDPSLFTLPYDQALAAGLEGAGHDVTLYGRRPGPNDSDLSGVKLLPEFYKLAGSRPVAMLPAPLRHLVLIPRNRETLYRLALLAEGRHREATSG